MNSLFEVKKVAGSLDVVEVGNKLKGGLRPFLWFTPALFNPFLGFLPFFFFYCSEASLEQYGFLNLCCSKTQEGWPAISIIHWGSPHLCQETWVVCTACTGLPKGSNTCFAGLTPQPCSISITAFSTAWYLSPTENREDNRDNVFSSKKGEEGGCDGVGRQYESCGKRSAFQPFFSLLSCHLCSAPIFWLAVCTKFASDVLPLFSHKR